MSKKTLNHANLAALGPDRLAHLLLEVSTGSADIKRRLRLELSHNLGAGELAHEVRKRLAAIRRSTAYVGWRKRKALVKDLSTQAAMITDKIAPEDPSEAFDLLWEFVALAPSVFERVDDSRGEVGDVFRAALMRLGDIAPNAGMLPSDLAARTWHAVLDNSYGVFDGIIPLMADALGGEGLAQLRDLVEAHAEIPVPQAEEHAALRFLRELRGGEEDYATGQKDRLIRQSLQEIALAQGDTQAFIAQYTPDQMAQPRIAAQVAGMLSDGGRTHEALDILEAVEGAGEQVWDAAYIGCLLAMGRVADAQAYRWTLFRDTLDVQTLRDYLKPLPDFDDIEVEDSAKAHALDFPDVHAALQFFLDWPDLATGARLIEARGDELDGNLFHILTPAAEALRDRHPLAAVLLWRAMISHALWEGRAGRYVYAADHLMDCAAADTQFTDYGRFLPHADYVEKLRGAHRHKTSFWARVP
jgi:hypothetical protein